MRKQQGLLRDAKGRLVAESTPKRMKEGVEGQAWLHEYLEERRQLGIRGDYIEQRVIMVYP